MKIDVKNLFKRIIIIFFILCTSYYILMVVGYIIPDSLIENNWIESVTVINDLEDSRWEVLTGFESTKLDTFTDNLIFQKLRNLEDLNPLQAAMWNSGYTRYWMGSIPFIRLALVFMNYSTMRYLNVFVIFSLFALVFSYMHKVLGKLHAFTLAICLFFIQFWIFPLSFQYTPVYIILMTSILVLLYLYSKNKGSLQNIILLFFIVGSVTNYFDLLTAPLLTFGLPFIVFYCMKNRKMVQSFSQNILYFLSNSISWLSGYALTWAANWALTTLLTEENTFANAFNQIGVRTVSGELRSLQELFHHLFSIILPRPARILLLIILIIWIIYFINCRRDFKDIFNLSPIILVVLLPIFWIVILRNHSQHHVYFVYRTLAISVYGTLSYLILSIQRNRRTKK